MRFEEEVEGNSDSSYFHRGIYNIQGVRVPIEVESFRGRYMDLRAGAINPVFGCSSKEITALLYLKEQMQKRVFGRNIEEGLILDNTELKLRPANSGLILTCAFETDNLLGALRLLEKMDTEYQETERRLD